MVDRRRFLQLAAAAIAAAGEQRAELDRPAIELRPLDVRPHANDAWHFEFRALDTEGAAGPVTVTWLRMLYLTEVAVFVDGTPAK